MRLVSSADHPLDINIMYRVDRCLLDKSRKTRLQRNPRNKDLLAGREYY